jgi:hypothetical protein
MCFIATTARSELCERAESHEQEKRKKTQTQEKTSQVWEVKQAEVESSSARGQMKLQTGSLNVF